MENNWQKYSNDYMNKQDMKCYKKEIKCCEKVTKCFDNKNYMMKDNNCGWM